MARIKIKIFQLIGIGILIHFLSWMFWFFYPLAPFVIYFAAGVFGQKTLPDHKFYTGCLLALPGIIVLGSIILGQMFGIDEASSFNLDTVILFMIPAVLTALIGSLLGEQICASRD